MKNLGKIALFSPNLGGGGAERVLVILAKELIKRKIRVDVILADASGELIQDLPHEARVIDFGKKRTILGIHKLVKYLKKERPAILLSTQRHANVVAMLSKIFSKTKTKVFLREANVFFKTAKKGKKLNDFILRRLVGLVYGYADGVIAVSRGVADDILKNVRIDKTKVHVIYNPADTKQIRKRANNKPKSNYIENGQSFILGVGRLEKQKDFKTLICALKEVRETNDVMLLILGEGKERENLENLVSQLGLEDFVNMPGYEKNPYYFMSQADLFVLSSAWEGMPNSLIEAIAIGVPVVSTDCHSGPREILENGKIGELVSVGDIKKLAGAIKKVLTENKQHTVDIAWERRYSTESFVNNYLSVFGYADK